MGKAHEITAEQLEEIREVREQNKNKRVDKWLCALQMRGEGVKNKDVAQYLHTDPRVISVWVSKYIKGGIEAMLGKKWGGNHRNISYAEETELLESFDEQAEAGHIIEVGDIKQAYEKKVGHSIGKGHIYIILKRHNWRKVKPRSVHPKKASEAEIEAAKNKISFSGNPCEICRKI